MKVASLLVLVAAGCASGSVSSAPPTTAAAPQAAALPNAASLAALAWLAGTHRFESGDRIVEEVWTAPGGATMFGINRDLRDGAIAGFEFLRIEARGDAVVYVAHPGGRIPGTEFTLRPGGEEGVFVFENPAHDFPKRVIYRRVDAQRTQARAENDEDALVFDFIRVGPDS